MPLLPHAECFPTLALALAPGDQLPLLRALLNRLPLPLVLPRALLLVRKPQRPQAMPRRRCPAGDAPQAMPRRQCPAGDAPQAMPRRQCPAECPPFTSYRGNMPHSHTSALTTCRSLSLSLSLSSSSSLPFPPPTRAAHRYLEDSSRFRGKTGDFVWMLLLGAASMLALAPFIAVRLRHAKPLHAAARARGGGWAH